MEYETLVEFDSGLCDCDRSRRLRRKDEDREEDDDVDARWFIGEDRHVDDKDDWRQPATPGEVIRSGFFAEAVNLPRCYKARNRLVRRALCFTAPPCCGA